MVDLQPAADTVARIVGGVRDDQLTAPTPCTESTVGDLIDHVDGLSLAFTAAARKTSLPGGSQAPKPSAPHLGTDCRERIPGRLSELAAAWRDPEAWGGMTEAGGRHPRLVRARGACAGRRAATAQVARPGGTRPKLAGA